MPDAIDDLRLQRWDGTQWAPFESRTLEGREMLFTGIPSGPQTLRFVACEGPAARYVASPPPFELAEDSKVVLNLSFRPLGALACTGPGQDYAQASDPYAGLGRARAFAASAPLGDGRVLIAGGASAYEGGRLTSQPHQPEWDIYDPTDLVFLPGTNRAIPLTGRELITRRVGAIAAPYQGPGGTAGGALLIGGTTELSLDITRPYGPFSPKDDAIATPFVSYFDAATGQLSPVSGPEGSLTPRFFPGAAGDGRRVVIAGGVELPDEAPSAAVDLIDQGTITSHRLGVGLYGPSVNLLDDDYALAWGASTSDCGAQPGWLVPMDGSAPSALALDGSDAPPACPEEGAPPAPPCRAWYPTAHHSAVTLPPNGAGRPRVLITGGLRVRGNALVSNPYFGDGCPANAFVLTVDTAAKRGTITPIDLSEPGLNTALQRAFHGGAIVGNDGLIAGGWVLGNAVAALTPTASVLTYSDRLAAGTFSRSALPDTIPRLGHVVVPTDDGTILLAGGLERQADETLAPTHLAEVYSPPLRDGDCGQDAADEMP